MNIKRRIIHDTYLDEFLYSLMFNSTRQQRERFPPEFIGVFRTSRDAKGFIAKATMEQKLYFLSLLGVEWFLLCGTRKNATKDLKEIVAKFKNESHSAGLNAITDKNIFVISGDQFIDYLGIMASMTHRKNYSYNVDLMKTGYHLHKWKKDVDYKNYNEISENNESYESIVKFVKSILLHNISIEANHAIKQTDLLILAYLYESKGAYVAHDAICDYFGGIFKKVVISTSIKLLRDINLIRISAIADKKEYSITPLGIDKLNKFIKKTITANI